MIDGINRPDSNEQHADGDAFIFAQTLIKNAGERMRSIMSTGYETTWKPDNTPLTTIDTDVNKFIIDEIHRDYPNDRIFGEEASMEGGSSFTWVVDPTDGTQALGILPTSTCCLARVDSEGNPLFGLVYNPASDELFAAKRGETTTLNGQPLRVSKKDQLKGSYIFLGSRMPETVATNGEIYDRLEAQGSKILNARSLAFGCVMVAAGKVEGAFIGAKTPFEAASVKLIVEGAGGKVTDLYGNESGRLDGEIRGLIVSNGLIHEKLLAAVGRV